MAQGLWELHQTKGEQEWERTFGPLTPDHIFYDQFADRLRVPPIGVSSFLWHVLDWNAYKDWVDSKAKFYIAPEQRDSPAGRLTPITDQYMLGRLGVELLEGLRFEQILNGKGVEQFWENPDSFIEGTWKSDRAELWTILKKMMQKNPLNRFSSMYEAVQSLRAVEEEGRALSSLRLTQKQSDLQLAFVKTFYKKFFAASPESEQRFADKEQQYSKFVAALHAVRTFRREINQATCSNYYTHIAARASPGMSLKTSEKALLPRWTFLPLIGNYEMNGTLCLPRCPIL
jgi:serine/threonine protein kinase